jgi:hypothetical protein
VEKIKQILSDLTNLCYRNKDLNENNPEHQRILANVSAHDAVVEILKLPPSRYEDPDREANQITSILDIQNDVLQACFTFLAAFCHNHPGNQVNRIRFILTLN